MGRIIDIDELIEEEPEEQHPPQTFRDIANGE